MPIFLITTKLQKTFGNRNKPIFLHKTTILSKNGQGGCPTIKLKIVEFKQKTPLFLKSGVLFTLIKNPQFLILNYLNRLSSAFNGYFYEIIATWQIRHI